jgi:hypothetical protein
LSVFIGLGVGPNQYQPRPAATSCPNLGSEIEVLKNSFISEMKVKIPKSPRNEFFSLVEDLYINETIKAIPRAIDVSVVKCTNDQIEDLKLILKAYQEEIKTDENCKKYFENTNKLIYLEKFIQLYERK